MKAEQLRKSILQMAIQGKLVPQDSSDEPASVLLEKIRAEKENLIKQGKIKKEKNDSVIFKGEDGKFYEKIGKEIKDITEELPFEIPDAWSWCRIRNCYDIRNGFTPLRSETKFWENGTIPWFTIEDIHKQGKIISYTKQHITTEAVTIERMVPANSFLLCCTASVGVFAQTVIPLTTNQQFNALTVKNLYKILIRDDYLLGIGDYFSDLLHEASGKTTFEFVSTKKLGEFLIPIPPLNEQKRIVKAIEKFEPLLAEYDKLEQQATKLDNEIFDKIKKSVLQYAIQGKLVPQDSSDEPASVLLAKIKAEKESLMKQGKIKKEKPLAPITDDEKPFDIPDNWEWVRLGTVLEIARGGSPRPIKDYLTDDVNGYNWIKIGDTDKGGKYINSTREKINTNALSKTRMVYKGDFLLTNSMSFGRPYILNIDGCIHDGWLALSNKYLSYDVDFLYHLLSSSFAYNQFCDVVSGAVVKNLNIEKVEQSTFPIPPFNEQKRIVARIEEIFAQIDKMKF